MKGDIMKAMPRNADPTFTPEEQAAVYKCIFNRRDIRGQFLADPIPDEVLGRILRAAHHAPSVGFMQPWTSSSSGMPQSKSASTRHFRSPMPKRQRCSMRKSASRTRL
jgi:hypothetical protein